MIALRHINAHEMRLFAEIAPVVLAGSGWLLAQASGADPSIANLIGNGVTVAVLAFYVLYDVRHRTPAIVSAFTREQDEARRAFKEEQAGSREQHKQEQAEQRKAFATALDMLLKDNREDRAKMREAHAAEIADWRKMVTETIQATRTAVHDTRDLAQKVISRVEALDADNLVKQTETNKKNSALLQEIRDERR